MYDIIQLENDFESVVESKDTQAEAQEYVSALNEMYQQEQIQFYYRLTN